VDYLLLHCALAYALWSYVFGLFGVHWVMLHNRVIDLLAGWQNWLNQCSSTVWILVPLCLMWILRRELNYCTSEDVEFRKCIWRLFLLKLIS